MNKKILLNIIDKNYLLKKFLKIVIYGREYKKTFDYLLKNDSLNIDKEKDLLELLKYSIDNVKFYQKQNIIEMKINKFPLITKKEIFKNEKEFISKKYNIERLNRFSTGGTTGFSLNLYKNKVEISREVAYVDYLFYKIVGKKNYIKGILRSHDTEEGTTAAGCRPPLPKRFPVCRGTGRRRFSWFSSGTATMTRLSASCTTWRLRRAFSPWRRGPLWGNTPSPGKSPPGGPMRTT